MYKVIRWVLTVAPLLKFGMRLYATINYLVNYENLQVCPNYQKNHIITNHTLERSRKIITNYTIEDQEISLIDQEMLNHFTCLDFLIFVSIDISHFGITVRKFQCTSDKCLSCFFVAVVIWPPNMRFGASWQGKQIYIALAFYFWKSWLEDATQTSDYQLQIRFFLKGYEIFYLQFLVKSEILITLNRDTSGANLITYWSDCCPCYDRERKMTNSFFF